MKNLNFWKSVICSSFKFEHCLKLYNTYNLLKGFLPICFYTGSDDKFGAPIWFIPGYNVWVILVDNFISVKMILFPRKKIIGYSVTANI